MGYDRNLHVKYLPLAAKTLLIAISGHYNSSRSTFLNSQARTRMPLSAFVASRIQLLEALLETTQPILVWNFGPIYGRSVQGSRCAGAAGRHYGDTERNGDRFHKRPCTSGVGPTCKPGKWHQARPHDRCQRTLLVYAVAACDLYLGSACEGI